MFSENPLKKIDNYLEFIKNRVEYFMKTHQAIDVDEFVVLCQNVVNTYNNNYTWRSSKFKEFFKEKNDYFADLYYQVGNILKTYSTTDAVNFYKKALTFKVDHKKALEALEIISKLDDHPNVMEIEGTDDLATVAYIDSDDNYLNSLSAYQHLTIPGRLEAVLKIYQSRLQIVPEDAKDYYYRMAMVCQVQGRLDKAVEFYGEAIKLNPGNLKTHYNMAKALICQERLAEASESFSQIIKLQSGNIEAYKQLAKIYYDLNKPNEAIKIYQDLNEMFNQQGRVELTEEIKQKIATIQATIEVAHHEMGQENIISHESLLGELEQSGDL